MKYKSLLMLLITQFFAFLPLSISADQDTIRPFGVQDLVGTWEAFISPPPSDRLFHMQINATGDSYLVEATPGPPGGYLVRRLLSAEVRNGAVRLHFGKPLNGPAGMTPPDVLIVGKANYTTIQGWFNLCNDCPPPAFPSSTDWPATLATEGTPMITFVKGPWTRAVGEASRIAEERIRDLTGADPATGIEGIITAESVDVGVSGPLGNSTFTVQKGKQTIASFMTDKQGHFRVWLKPGHYTVSTIGDSGGANSCGPFEAEVAAGKMTKVKWSCKIKMK